MSWHNCFLFIVFVGTHKTCCFGKYQLEIHRYLIQIRSWTFPDYCRQGSFHGSIEEGQDSRRRESHSGCKIIVQFHYLTIYNKNQKNQTSSELFNIIFQSQKFSSKLRYQIVSCVVINLNVLILQIKHLLTFLN